MAKFKVLHSMITLRDPETNRKIRYFQGDEVELNDKQSTRFMQEGDDVVHGKAVESVEDVKARERERDKTEDNDEPVSDNQEIISTKLPKSQQPTTAAPKR